MKRLSIATLALVSFAVVACSAPERSAKALEDQGYTDIQTGGHAWFACSEDDVFKTKFKAKMNGRDVEGAVCSGWFKGNTVRTN